MKDFDVYGIGAALVDLEAKVSETFLSSNKIRKGVMTLVDGTKQLELLEDLSECGVDVICKSGGSVCNSLIAASNFGSRVFLVVKWQTIDMEGFTQKIFRMWCRIFQCCSACGYNGNVLLW